MTHNKTWNCSKPDGDGCDGNHKMTSHRERAEKLTDKLNEIVCDIQTADIIEAFAKEVEAQAYEKSAELFVDTENDYLWDAKIIIKKILALKEPV